MYSDGGSQGHFPWRQGHPQHLCGPLQPLTAAGPQAPGSRLVPTLAPRGHFQMTWSLPSGAPHHPRRNPTLLSLELQAPPAPSLPAPLGLTHICTHLHMHSAHTLTIDTHTCIHSQIRAHILTHSRAQSHMYTRDRLHSHACSLLHTQTSAFTLLQMYTRALAPPTSPTHSHINIHVHADTCLHTCAHTNTPTQHTCAYAATRVHVCMHQRTRAHVSIPITHTSCAH